MSHFYLTQYDWIDSDPTDAHWGVEGAHCVDLRPLASQGKKAIKEGNCIAAFPTTVSRAGATYLGDGGRITARAKNSLETAVNLNGELPIDELAETVYQLRARYSAPDGLNTSYPITPDRLGRIRMRMGDLWVTKRFRRDMPEWPNMLNHIQEQYRRVRADTVAGRYPSEQHLKYLARLSRKYKLDYHTFIANDLPDEGTREPATQLVENYSGSTGSIDTNGDLNWTTLTGDLRVNASNQCESFDTNTYGGAARCDDALSDGDQFSYTTVITLTVGSDNRSYVGTAARFSTSAETFYYARCQRRGAGDTLTMRKRVTGSDTDLGGGDVSVTHTLPDQIKIDVDTNAQEMFYPDLTTSKATDTDSAIGANLRAGVNYRGATTDGAAAIGDSWVAEDSTGAGGGGTAVKDMIGRGIVPTAR